MQTAWSARLLSLGLAFSLAAFAGCRREEAAGSAAPADSAAPTTLRVLGPGGGGGQFLPTVNPADRDHIFIRCDMTGAYVSHDGGQSWRQFHLRTVVSDFEFAPGEPDVIYAANSGLYRSEDRGASWSLIYPRPEEVLSERMIGDHAEQSFETRDGMPDGDIEKVRVDPADPARLYLGLAAPFRWHPARGREFSADSCGLVVSLDRGATWKLLARLPGRTVLAILPGSWDGRPDELTVVTERSLARVEISTGKVSPRPLPVERVIHADGGHGQEAGTVIYLLAGLEQQGGKLRGGIYRSADGGKSWEQANQGLLEDFPATGALPSFRTFAVCESDPRVAYLSCDTYPAAADSGKAERQYGIFKTEDGSSWRWVYRADNERQIERQPRWRLDDGKLRPGVGRVPAVAGGDGHRPQHLLGHRLRGQLPHDRWRGELAAGLQPQGRRPDLGQPRPGCDQQLRRPFRPVRPAAPVRLLHRCRRFPVVRWR